MQKSRRTEDSDYELSPSSTNLRFVTQLPVDHHEPDYELEGPLPWWLIDDLEDDRGYARSIHDDYLYDPDPDDFSEYHPTFSLSAKKARSMIPHTVQDFRYTQTDDGEIESIYYGPGITSPDCYRYVAPASMYNDIFPPTPPCTPDSSDKTSVTSQADSAPEPATKRYKTDEGNEDLSEDEKMPEQYEVRDFNINIHSWMDGEPNERSHMNELAHNLNENNHEGQHDNSGSRAYPQIQRSESSRPATEHKSASSPPDRRRVE